MAEKVTVDYAALEAASKAVDQLAGAVERRRGALTAVLVAVEGTLAGAACVGVLAELSTAVDDVHGDLVTALGGFAEGLEHVVERVMQADEVTASAARSSW